MNDGIRPSSLTPGCVCTRASGEKLGVHRRAQERVWVFGVGTLISSEEIFAVLEMRARQADTIGLIEDVVVVEIDHRNWAGTEWGPGEAVVTVE